MTKPIDRCPHCGDNMQIQIRHERWVYVSERGSDDWEGEYDAAIYDGIVRCETCKRKIEMGVAP